MGRGTQGQGERGKGKQVANHEKTPSNLKKGGTQAAR
jgi:hypothetical protein